MASSGSTTSVDSTDPAEADTSPAAAPPADAESAERAATAGTEKDAASVGPTPEDAGDEQAVVSPPTEPEPAPAVPSADLEAADATPAGAGDPAPADGDDGAEESQRPAEDLAATAPGQEEPAAPEPAPVPATPAPEAAEPEAAEPEVAEPEAAEPEAAEPAAPEPPEVQEEPPARSGEQPAISSEAAPGGEPAPETPTAPGAPPTSPATAEAAEPPASAEPPAPAGPPPNWAEQRAQQLIAAVAGDTQWAEERGTAADPQAVEYWLELAAAAAARGRHASDETAEAQRVSAPPRRRRAPGAAPTAPPPAPTPRRLAGSTVVTPKYSRFGARVVLLAILALAVVVALVAGGITLLNRPHSRPAAAPSVPAPRLPVLGNAKPLLAALSQSAQVPDPAALAGRVGPLLAAPALGSSTHAEVVDVATGKVLLDSDAETAGAPASTAKLLTATAVLTTLDPAATIPTTVVAGSTPGEVVLVGGGDPTLSRTDPSQSYPGAATMTDLAGQVTRALPAGTKITRIVVDGSLFTGPATGPGWQPEDAPSSYASPITSVAVDGGRVSASSQMRSGSPAIDAGKALADALGVHGVPVVAGQAPAGAQQLGAVHSAPVVRLVEQALSMSDNVLAEALARQVAIARHQPASFDGAVSAVLAADKEAGVDTTGVQMFDGSGLSRQDRVPARVLADLVAGAASGKLGTGADFLSGLPVAGFDGTLADRGDADPATAPGSVRAKTGTLAGVSALAGTVVTADGRLLAFAVLADGVPGSVSAAENALDAVARSLAGCGCG